MLQNEKNRDLKQKPLLLFSPLDWGLGHTTRSIPLLRAFQDEGWQIVVACASTQKSLLEAEINDLTFVNLPGYRVSYSARGSFTKAKIILQLIKILMQIKRERRWLQHYLRQNSIQAVLSDNRYGLFHPSVPCVFITHQLQPRTGMGRNADKLFQSVLYRFIDRFSTCWIPDNERSPQIADELSHPTKKPSIPLVYLGPLSRLSSTASQPYSYKLLVIISGPEPQRTVFEKQVLDELRKLNDNEPKSGFVLVRGLPGVSGRQSSYPNVTIFNHLESNKMNDLVSRSEFVLCRSGYSSLMDLLKLKKKMILVPTPGQPEQEYLAAYFQENAYAVSFNQSRFSLANALQTAEAFDYNLPEIDTEVYRKVVAEFSRSLILNYPNG